MKLIVKGHSQVNDDTMLIFEVNYPFKCHPWDILDENIMKDSKKQNKNSFFMFNTRTTGNNLFAWLHIIIQKGMFVQSILKCSIELPGDIYSQFKISFAWFALTFNLNLPSAGSLNY